MKVTKQGIILSLTLSLITMKTLCIISTLKFLSLQGKELGLCLYATEICGFLLYHIILDKAY